jgi:hypothetical protein
MEKYGPAGQATDDNIIGTYVLHAGITKATDTQSEFVIIIAFSSAAMVTRTRVSITLLVLLLSWRYLPLRSGVFSLPV